QPGDEKKGIGHRKSDTRIGSRFRFSASDLGNYFLPFSGALPLAGAAAAAGAPAAGAAAPAAGAAPGAAAAPSAPSTAAPSAAPASAPAAATGVSSMYCVGGEIDATVKLRL